MRREACGLGCATASRPPGTPRPPPPRPRRRAARPRSPRRHGLWHPALAAVGGQPLRRPPHLPLRPLPACRALSRSRCPVNRGPGGRLCARIQAYRKCALACALRGAAQRRALARAPRRPRRTRLRRRCAPRAESVAARASARPPTRRRCTGAVRASTLALRAARQRSRCAAPASGAGPCMSSRVGARPHFARRRRGAQPGRPRVARAPPARRVKIVVA